MEAALTHVKGTLGLFYIVNPYESLFKDESQIPKPSYVAQAIPYFFVLVILENLTLWVKGKQLVRFNDGLTSMANGAMMMLKDIILKGFLMGVYCDIYDKYRVLELPWDSVITWIVAALCVDLGYYWGHRASHELNILWAAHQVHHSSEDYNLTTALRQSMMQGFGTMPCYLPFALCVPPVQVIVHLQFNLLYQFWIHTEAVRTIGPLEHILNTPQHHRVHHGSNRYCLDKNYAGVLIIWDRIFGTFDWERPNEEIVYGLVDQPQFFNPLKHQVFYYGKVLEKAKAMETWSDKVSAFVKGPGWFPGTSRLGDITQVPESQDRSKYDPDVPMWYSVYALLHFGFSLLMLMNLGDIDLDMSQTSVLFKILFLFWTLTSIGWIFDNSRSAWISETVRCLTCLMLLDNTHELLSGSLTKEYWNTFTLLSLVTSTLCLMSPKSNDVFKENKD